MSLSRVLIAWVFTIVYWPVVVFAYVLSFKSFPESWVTGSIRFWGKAILSILGIRLELVNENPMTDRRGRVVIINHQSALDILWTAAIAPPASMAIGKKEVIFIPIINLAWWAFGFVRVDRKNHSKALQALAGVGEKIRREQRSLFIAVEGTRTFKGDILRFKKGAFHIAKEAGAPIYPIVVDGAFQLLPRNRFLPKPGVIRLLFLPPVGAEEIQRKVGGHDVIEEQDVAGKQISAGHEEMDVLIEKVRGDMIAALARMRQPTRTL